MAQRFASIAALVTLLASNAYAVDNGLAITPQMGWVSYPAKKVLG
jgi:hypothetical protein